MKRANDDTLLQRFTNWLAVCLRSRQADSLGGWLGRDRVAELAGRCAARNLFARDVCFVQLLVQLLVEKRRKLRRRSCPRSQSDESCGD